MHVCGEVREGKAGGCALALHADDIMTNTHCLLPVLHPQADKDCEALRAELNRVAAQVREQEAAMAEHAAQIAQLQGAIAEAEQVGLWFVDCRQKWDT